ncbi:MAG: T9SS type A sorting domain-containing protein [candidate division KSB1 bacterium]|nr:T9SS type A sorting domain-containing protein [candidate division KSB1 bacterium]MDZ7300603.1 T9SS type A sorting domain-containing protein [candidate division KSB1 bacterium]MDZ7309740.1 T9SS type A sorting domain-containing protein [candidate division KSB1 bacterium]
MKKFHITVVLAFVLCASIYAQSLTTVILPQYIEGINGTNTNRIPFAYRARLSGLLPNATYRFMNQIVTSADAATTNGAGNCIFVSPTGDFVRTSSPSLSTSGNYGTFTTDATGTYEGWFVTEPTGNARFVPGKFIFMRINLNDGGSGTSVVLRLTTTDSVRVVKLDTTATDDCGTGLRCTSAASPKDFVFAYDNTDGTGRPISGSFIESDGTDNSSANNYAAFYANNVNGVTGAFGIVLPNKLPNGVKRIERRSLSTGTVTAFATDDDGVWPSGASTVNPKGGTTAIVLTGTDVSLVTSIQQRENVPLQFTLSQNYPNPFSASGIFDNPTTMISFSLPEEAFVKLEVFNVLGARVATLVNERRAAGSHTVSFNAALLPSGFYFYKMSAGGFVMVRKLAFIK